MSRYVVLLILFVESTAFAQQWKLVKPMQDARTNFGVGLIGNGRVLVAGGRGISSVLSSSEIYDESTDTWTYTAPLHIARQNAPLVRLLNGSLYFPSGLTDAGNSMTSAAEQYEPASGSWSFAPNLLDAREGESAITLPNGRVLIVAGLQASTSLYQSSSELYDPATTSELSTGSISTGQFGVVLFLDTLRNTVTMISDHFNGAAGTWLDNTEEYNIASGTWSVVAHSGTPHGIWPQQGVELPNGDILAPSGGDGIDQASQLIEVYTPTTHRWRTIGIMPTPRYLAASAYIGNDSVLVTGGYDPATKKSLDDCTIINVKTGVVSAGPKLNEARHLHRLVIENTIDPNDSCLSTTTVYVLAGMDETGTPKASCEMLSFTHGVPSTLQLPSALSYNGSICDGIDTSFAIMANSCGTTHIDSIILDGIPTGSIHISGPDTLRPGQTRSYSVSVHSQSALTANGQVHLYYNFGGVEHDTTFNVSATLGGWGGATTTPIVADALDAGDTVFIPIYITQYSGRSILGFSLQTHYDDRDFLDPIDPQFNGTLCQGATNWSRQTSATGIHIDCLQPFTLAADRPLVILAFKTYLSRSRCARLFIDTLRLIFDSASAIAHSNAVCPFAMLGDSITICRAGHCGDSTIRHLLLTGELPAFRARYNPDAETIELSDAIIEPHAIEIINAMGQLVRSISQDGTSPQRVIPASDFSSGFYLLRTHTSAREYVTRVVITK